MRTPALHRTTIALILLAAALTALTGCSTLSDTWDSTWNGSKELYSEYVNPDPEVDLEKIEHAQWEEKMAESLTPVDTRLTMMLRYLGLQSNVPDKAWMDKLFDDFPWISGCIVADMSGQVLSQRPEAAMKPVDVTPFLAVGDGFKDRHMRAAFENSPLGPEIYAATPIFKGNDLAGFVAVHFDMRNLMTYSQAPGQFVVVTPGLVQWSGDHPAEARELADMPWDEILADEVEGETSLSGQDWIWLTRYIGDKNMIYAVQGERDAPARWWTFGLF